MRGGPRPGAGRKTKEYGRKVTIAIRVRPDLKRRIVKEAKDWNVSVTALIEDALIRQFITGRDNPQTE